MVAECCAEVEKIVCEVVHYVPHEHPSVKRITHSSVRNEEFHQVPNLHKYVSSHQRKVSLVHETILQKIHTELANQYQCKDNSRACDLLGSQ